MKKLIVLCLGLFGLASCAPLTETPVVYTRQNIHVHARGTLLRASYANWTDPGDTHFVLPVNTPVAIESWEDGFTVIPQDEPKKIQFIVDRGRVGMSIRDYVHVITSPVPVPLDGLSGLDRKGIDEGRAYLGMSREGVRIALGYPSPHRTPTLKMNTWTYWKNRINFYMVEFDERGLVTAVR